MRNHNVIRDITDRIIKRTATLVEKKGLEKTHHELKIIMARTAAAYSFYKLQAGYRTNIDGTDGKFDASKGKIIEKRIECIDFHYRVQARVLPTQMSLQQYVGKHRGRFYSHSNATPSELGIHHEFKDLDGQIKDKSRKQYLTSKPIEVLESVAAPAQDTWSIESQSYATTGGAIQFFTPKRELKKHIVEQKKQRSPSH